MRTCIVLPFLEFGCLGIVILPKPKDIEMRNSRQALITKAGYALQAYQRSSQAFDDAVGRALGLNATDVRCLDWLADGPKTAGKLSAGTGLSAAATTTLIDRLEHKGFVQRVRDPGDRRKVLVEMTPGGAARVGTYYGRLIEEGSGLFEGITDEQLEQMRVWLEAAGELTDRHRMRIDAELRAGSRD
jgi:DNA-binding MarR family transcriptional regulator